MNPGWVAVPEKDLPVKLPKVKYYEPTGTGESPLAAIEKWVNAKCPRCGGKGKRETNTMPQWAGSSWYYLAYILKHNSKFMLHNSFAKRSLAKWLPVDLYVGGAEHATRHLIYARFWHKFLYDSGIVSVVEPFMKLQPVGLIMGEDGRKMSKSLGNVINPDDVVEEFGTDSLRMFEMFLGPLQDAKPWSKSGIEGVNRFLSRVWRMIVEDNGTLSVNVKDVRLSLEQEQILHYTIKKVSDDIEELHFNTAVSQMMIFVNEFTKYEIKPREAMEKFILCLSPFAPHIAEELWQILGHNDSIVLRNFPEFDELKAAKKQIEFVVQVQSRIRAKLYVAPGLEQEEIQQMALKDDKVQKFIEGKTIKKVIFVPNKLINFIV